MKRIYRGFNLKSIIAGLGAAALFVASPVMAGGNHHHGKHFSGHHGSHHYDRGYDRQRRHFNRHNRRHFRQNLRHNSLYAPHRYTDHRVAYVYPPQPVVSYSTYPSPVYGGRTTVHHSRSPNFGNAVGGALGGYLGSQIGHGSGRLAATAAGAVIGYSVGGHLGAGR